MITNLLNANGKCYYDHKPSSAYYWIIWNGRILGKYKIKLRNSFEYWMLVIGSGNTCSVLTRVKKWLVAWFLMDVGTNEGTKEPTTVCIEQRQTQTHTSAGVRSRDDDKSLRGLKEKRRVWWVFAVNQSEIQTRMHGTTVRVAGRSALLDSVLRECHRLYKEWWWRPIFNPFFRLFPSFPFTIVSFRNPIRGRAETGAHRLLLSNYYNTTEIMLIRLGVSTLLLTLKQAYRWNAAFAIRVGQVSASHFVTWCSESIVLRPVQAVTVQCAHGFVFSYLKTNCRARHLVQAFLKTAETVACPVNLRRTQNRLETLLGSSILLSSYLLTRLDSTIDDHVTRLCRVTQFHTHQRISPPPSPFLPLCLPPSSHMAHCSRAVEEKRRRRNDSNFTSCDRASDHCTRSLALQL